MAELPQGVTIGAHDATTYSRGWLLIKNETDQPLYIMSLNHKDVLVMVTPDPGWKTRLNTAHEAAAYLVSSGRPAALTIEALASLDSQLVDNNILSFDPPAKNVTVPADQRSELLLVYAGQVIEVPFILTYSLNTGFDNGSETYRDWMEYTQATADAGSLATQQADSFRASQERKDILVVGLAGACLLIVLWLAWRSLRPHR